MAKEGLVVPVSIQMLIVSNGPISSVVVLQPFEEETQPGIFRVVPIWIGTAEATQLSVALDETKLSRPMTHDLFLDALTNLDARIDHVVINNVKGTTFFARLTLQQHDRLIDLDARPSDAIALAVRQKAPIYIEESVLERASFPYVLRNRENDSSIEEELDKFHEFISTLAPQDFTDEDP